ncbi:hypothetical protein [Paracoccus tibetensis]|uniref:Uncharacterized protein n=1 Tax=Paracoccus tibetensis TaxID=336292 RepID=A0A1G5CCE3_9RHOB|nr:hypothetical protein [Paracoccus tibetensis]SCX99988.1 hypothetical protein SAMN05660710_00502 [Paracoccus tibetensis]
MTHDPNLNTPHAKQPNPHDRGLRDPQPKRNTLRSLLFVLVPAGFLLLVAAMLLLARTSDGPDHSGAQAPPALQEPVPGATPDGEAGTAPAAPAPSQ